MSNIAPLRGANDVHLSGTSMVLRVQGWLPCDSGTSPICVLAQLRPGWLDINTTPEWVPSPCPGHSSVLS